MKWFILNKALFEKQSETKSNKWLSISLNGLPGCKDSLPEKNDVIQCAFYSKADSVEIIRNGLDRKRRRKATLAGLQWYPDSKATGRPGSLMTTSWLERSGDSGWSSCGVRTARWKQRKNDLAERSQEIAFRPERWSKLKKPPEKHWKELYWRKAKFNLAK